MSRYKYEPDQPWQLELVREIEGEPLYRKIIWIYDEIGNRGKTALGKWLFVTQPNKWYYAKDCGTTRDASTIIQNALSSGWTAWGIVIDLPRSAENHIRMYTYLEEFADGIVTTQKYSGKTIAFDSPWVVVFANWPPTLNKTLSLDRWDIREIQADGTVKYMDTYSILEGAPRERAMKSIEPIEKIDDVLDDVEVELPKPAKSLTPPKRMKKTVVAFVEKEEGSEDDTDGADEPVVVKRAPKRAPLRRRPSPRRASIETKKPVVTKKPVTRAPPSTRRK